MSSGAMLLGRERELAVVRHALTEARAGRSSVLVISGEAGIGKTALLEHAVGDADGFRVLTAQGVESESELAFAGLHELLRPILSLVEELPTPQGDAIRGAFRLASVEVVDRFAICVGVLDLLARAAEERPLLVAIDDAHWLDAASAEALTFAARRFDADGIAMLVALRDGAQSAFLAMPVERLPLQGLEREDVGELVGRSAASPLAATVVARLHQTTAGNPLALKEVADALNPDELAGRVPLPELLSPGRAIYESFARRLAALSDEARKALLIAAASDSQELDAILCAAQRSGVPDDAFTEAEAAQVIAVDRGTLRFHHPLLRSSVYAAASAVRRRDAHQALAACTTKRPERRAWHLAAAAVAPDEEIAAALERAAIVYSQQTGYFEAARALERAARLTPDDDERARRLLAAAEAAWSAGSGSWARELLEEALSRARDPLLRADVEFRQATVEAWAVSTTAARARYLAQAERLASRDAERAAAALSYAAALAVVAGDLDAALEAGTRAAELSRTTAVSSRTERVVAETLGTALIMRGEAERGKRLVARAASWFEDHDVLGGSHYAALSLIWVEEYEAARRLLERLIGVSRRRGDLRALAAGLEVAAELEFRTGDWQRAWAAASESVRLADETGQPVQLAYSAAVLAIVEAAQGRETARAHANRALDLGRQRGIDMIVEYVGYALGLLELGLGRSDRAIEDLETAAAFAIRSGRGEPGVLQWGPELVEAYVRAGRRREAEEALADFEASAEATARQWALAAAARCRVLLVPDEELDAAFAEAARRHRSTAAPFERARASLCVGERLRRARRRRDAREPLRTALEAFERLGASPWAAAARRELDATGETLPRRVLTADEVLTAQELQVALVVAGGATNKQAGATLFLSPKTIESHLSSAYRKLGVHSRVELVHRLGRAGPDAGFGHT